MKIVCDACQAKYSIADEKIQGKAFKIRCKKCNHIIVVKTSGEVAAAASVAAGPGQKSAPSSPAAPAAAASGADGGQAPWHVVVNGEQVGPLALAEVKDKLRLGLVSGDSLVWKEGYPDWTALSTVPELAALQSKTSPSQSAGQEASRPAVAAGAGPTNAKPASQEESTSTPDVFAVPTVLTPAVDVLAATAESSSPAAAARPSSASSSASSSAAPAPASPASLAISPALSPASTLVPSSPFLFGGAPAATGEPAVVIKNPGNGAGGTHLTGQRNENSVLFSLANLESLAVPSAGAGVRPPSSTSNTEGSGLIDIRSMAAMTLHEGGRDGHRSADALPTFSTPQFSPVAPVLLPISMSGPPKWVYPVLGLLAVGIFVIGFGIYREMAAPPPGNPIVIQQAAPPPSAPLPAAAPALAPPPAAAAPSAAPPESSRPVVEERPAPPAEKLERPERTGKSGKHHRGEAQAKTEKSDVKATAADTKAKAKELGDLLGDPGKKDEAPKSAQVRLASLTQSDIVNAMRGVQPRVQSCADKFKVPGTAMATVSVASGGKVASVTTNGKFAGSPTGSCIESAVRSARFPPCQAMTFPWPFTLSPR
ncbi:MAG: GYF domain-containing protein [Polyangia bacterium]|jgi:predicted Zn finger-like uncharacterized protein